MNMKLVNPFLDSKVKPSTKEGKVLLWALEAAADHFTTDEGARLRDGEKFDEIYKTVLNSILVVGNNEVIEDLIYRLSDQLKVMIRDASEYDDAAKYDLSAARRVVKKLESVKTEIERWY